MILAIILMTIAVGVILFFGIKMFIDPKKPSNQKPISGNNGGGGGNIVINEPNNSDKIEKDLEEVTFKEVTER